MKVILYMAQSLDGFIARENGETDFIGTADLKRFKEMSLKAGNVVMGRYTYQVIQREKQFPLPDRYNVVMTRQLTDRTDNDRILFTGERPKQVLEMLKEKQFEEAFIIGGGRLARSFLEEKLIDEIYITIEPIILGKGIPLVPNHDPLNLQLELLETYSISPHELQLHYQVNKTIYGI
jgi:dihydrofolate reductase